MCRFSSFGTGQTLDPGFNKRESQTRRGVRQWGASGLGIVRPGTWGFGAVDG